ncbi:hypothetical protein L1285_16705 [Pseudoalteromonas sp. DL2-H2.2]|uniref:hypothetical protein n=1 Tax=Pseudoalteromonas sp. DL2-H2.2 TaxID=2908889 RepID=UPI001F2ACD93|nr:hypothetical protein [Pseudoalteromonas sp. DL2-H2.2]MCF2909964.1 hypothetical protein [Pseudoalteromonas sp. DL2-H2.2]
MGILEVIEEKLDRVLGLLEGDDSVQETTLGAVMKDAKSADPEGFEQALAQVDTSSDVELDSNGLPWDERIHTSTKNKTEKGVWKKKRGVSEPVFNEVVAELKQKISSSKGEQVASESIANFPPVADGAPGAPNVPPVPGVPSAPGAPSVQKDFKKLSIQAINEITDKHKVDYAMLDEVFGLFGTKDFTLMQPEHHEGFHLLVDEYACDLNDTLELVQSIVGIAGQEAFDKYMADNFNVREYNQIPRTQLRSLIQALEPWNQQCISWQAQQAG